MGSTPSNAAYIPPSPSQSPRPYKQRHQYPQQDRYLDNQEKKLAQFNNYEMNPRYMMNIRDEPQRMLAPISGYEKKPLVSLEEACEPLNAYVSDLPRRVWMAKENSKHPADGLSPDESAAIHLYTMEWTGSLYSVLNKTLREVDRRVLMPWLLYLKLLITALFKLPSVRATIWRGVREDLSKQFVVGDHKVWWSFSSCTAALNVLENPMYLGNHGTRTLFSIEAYHGKIIKEHSFYKKEDEILLLPGTYFEVINNFDSGNNLHIIHLKQKRPPYTLLEQPFRREEKNLFNNALSYEKKPQTPHFAPPIKPPPQAPHFALPMKLPPQEPKGVKKIVFSDIPGAKRGCDRIPNGYEDLDWEDCQYVEESYAHNSRTSAWKKVFKHSRYVINNLSGKQKMYIRSSKPNKLFTIKSVDATVVDRNNSAWTLTGLRKNVKLYTKDVVFENSTSYQLIELDFVDIDEITFTTFNGYPELAVGCITIFI